MQAKGHFVFYGNSSKTMGAGHIMRLFALAQAVQKAGFRITFIYKECLSSLIDKLKNENFKTLQCSQLLEASFILQLKPGYLVIDDYNLTADEWIILKNLKVFKLLFDDEISQAPLFSDLIINSSPTAKLENYRRRAADALFCLGPKYTILRDEFNQAKSILKNIKQRKQILITLGGSDVKALALPVCQVLLKYLVDTNLVLLLGNADHKNLEQLQQLSDENKYFSLMINPDNVAQIMSASGLAITGAGGTLGELASMAVPSIALVYVDNQLSALTSNLNGTWYQAIDFREYACPAHSLQDSDMINRLALTVESLWNDEDKREKMSNKAQQIVDTNGCQRILQKIKGVFNDRNTKYPAMQLL